MHGRVKVKTSEQMKTIRLKEEADKARIFNSKMNVLLQKKSNEEYDEEIMTLATDIIHMNPDVLTVWNARKECLLDFKSKGVVITQDLVKAELKLTETGLRINPKSYCAWHHRCWVLENFADQSAWLRELKICSEYLKADDRNFHCWDYRRYVVGQHNVNVKDELSFTEEKLDSNFSNYSAWHYRSKLLPKVYPELQAKNVCDSEIYKSEFDRVERAIYTDPNDQSAWFYHRWLLGLISQPSKIVQSGYCRKLNIAWIVIYPSNADVTVQGLGNERWEYLNGNRSSNILMKKIPAEASDAIQLRQKDQEIDTVEFGGDFAADAFRSVLSETEEYVLQKQLKSFQVLLEMELQDKKTINKWCLLAILMVKERLGEAIDETDLRNLIAVDGFRENYYSNIIGRYKIEHVLRRTENWFGSIDLSNLRLDAFYHSYFFTHFKTVDLSNNCLGNKVVPKLAGLLSCETLNLSNCNLTSVDNFSPLPNLYSLNISKNRVKFDKLPSGLLESPLKFLDCSETLLNVHAIENMKNEYEIEVKY